VNKQVINSEKIVSDYLKKMGAVVSKVKETSNGIDIVAIKDGNYFLVEVKTAVKSTRSYYCNKLDKSGEKSTHIAIVTPKKRIIFDSIEDHIKLCNKKGIRFVTKTVSIVDI